MDYKLPDNNITGGLRKGSTISNTLAMFTTNNSNQSIEPTPKVPKKFSQDKPFSSLFERTMSLIAKLYSLPDFEFYLFPDGVDALLKEEHPVIDPIGILWRCFRLGAPLCHLLNQLKPQNLLSVPDVSGMVTLNVCKKCIYFFLIGAKDELKVGDDQLFTISELYKDDTNGLVKVIHAVDLVISEIEKRGLFPPEKPFPFATSLGLEDPADNRSKVVAELLATERAYIESLQELLQYKDDLSKSNAISKDLIHSMFANLSELVDFQRRFLFSLETELALPPTEQHIGAIFLQYEEAFSVYDSMCANYSNAVQVGLQVQERLAGIGSIDAGRQLQAYLIKPEIAKYSTKENYPFLDELEEALLSVKRVTDRVNEVQRIQENRVLKDKLISLVEDWKDFNPTEWGDLMLYDKFQMLTQGSLMDYHIYLFERVILCCKEVTKDPTKLKKGKNGVDEPSTVYEIKGQIYANSITSIENTSDESIQHFELKVFWNDDEESFILKCRNIEQVELWLGRIHLTMTGDTKNVLNTLRLSQQSSNSDKGNQRRNIQSVNPMSLKDNVSRRVSDDHNMRNSMPASVHRSRTPNGTAEILPRGSSMYHNKNGMPRPRGASEASGMPPTREYTRKSSISGSSGMERTSSPRGPPKPPSSALPAPPSGPPSSALPRPPTADLPRPPMSGPPAAALPQPPSSGPPSSPLPLPPQGGPPMSPLPEPPMGRPPMAALPRPPSNGPPSSALPQTPSSGPPLSALPQTPSSGPPSSALPQPPSGPPMSPLPQPPSGGPPNAGLPRPPSSASSSRPPTSALPATPSGLGPMSPPPASPLPETPSSRPPTSQLPAPPSARPPNAPLPAVPGGPPSASLPSPPGERSRATRDGPPTGSLPSPPTSEGRPRRSTIEGASLRTSPGLTKVKTHYGDDIFILAVSSKGCKFEELLDKIERKINISGAAMPEGRRIKLRYRDEDGDFISINSDDDVEMAFELARRMSDRGTVTVMAQ
ncbi:hypothetical protein HDV02_005160 [Globomyces sp. JEL0801]|nr:hypothetical protein HDV02_005160 [Globomyces sp. JEL0801]